MFKRAAQLLAPTTLLLVAGCSSAESLPTETSTLTLRDLTANTSAPVRDSYPIEGKLISTPSDDQTRYYLIRHRKPLGRDTVFALLREETGAKAAYAQVEVDCSKRLFHIVGVGNRRSSAELSSKSDGPLRPIDGFPLRKEIASYVCERAGMPLTGGITSA